jgi:YHS domain-containing protein
MEMNMNLLTRTAAASADETNVSTGGTLAAPGLAAQCCDVVAFFADGSPTVGSDKFVVAHKGGTYRFASQTNLDAFKADADKYLRAYGGFCAYGTALGKKLDGDPRVWKIVDGTLYFNLNPDVAVAWTKNIPGNIAKADGNWSRIRGIASAKL